MVLGIFDQPGLFGIGPGASGCFWFLQAMSMRRVMRNPEHWRRMGLPDDRIFFLPKENNWWGRPVSQALRPDTEMFLITDKEPCGPDCSPACDCGRYLEIWNDVFMEYNKQADGSYLPLEQKTWILAWA